MADTTDTDDLGLVDLGDGASQLDWAKAVLWASQNLSQAKMTKKKAGSLARFIYWQHGRTNPQALLVDMVPKALSILDKQNAGAGAAGLEAAESEHIAELEALLDDVLVEAGLK